MTPLLRTLGDSFDLGVLHVPREAGPPEMNATARKIVGRDCSTFEELVTTLFNNPASRDRFRELLLTGERDGGAGPQEIAAEGAPDLGAVYEVRILRSDDGLYAFLRDVTRERKQKERVGRAERLAALGQLSAGVAHEFNNILTAILGWAQISLRDPTNRDLVEAALHTIESNSKRAKGVVRDLMNYARPEETPRSPSSLGPIMDDVLRLLNWELRNAGIRVTKVYGDAPEVVVHRGQVYQVFLNLVLNAMQAMPQGGELIVAIKPCPNDAGAMVEVTDTGIGMSAETRARVFEPFFTTKRGDGQLAKAGGSGLGLAICQRIIGEHGGEIRVASTEGKGSTFTVIFPPPERDSHVSGAADGADEDGGSLAMTVLVVDDESDIREMLRTALALRGAEVTTAADAPGALEFLRSRVFDAVLLDYTMPGSRGDDLFEQMRAVRPTIPVFFVTGRSTLDPPARVQPAGWIRKPFDLAEVYRSLRPLAAARRGAA